MKEEENIILNLNDCLRQFFNNEEIVNGYLLDYRMNIYPNEMNPEHIRMFNNGNGNELLTHARALHSSSMLAYNFFHWISREHPFVFDNIKFTDVFFEVQLPTLVGSGYPSNMDVVLVGRDAKGRKTLLFIESKFTEHESSNHGEMQQMLNDSYSHDGETFYDNNQQRHRWLRYYPTNRLYVDCWHNLINAFDPNLSHNGGYLDGIKQEICHIIAITNLKNDTEAISAYNRRYSDNHRSDVRHPAIDGTERMLFYNVLFDRVGSSAYSNYKGLYDRFKLSCNDIPSCSAIEMHIISYRDIFNNIPDGELKSYLFQRYMKFSN